MREREQSRRVGGGGGKKRRRRKGGGGGRATEPTEPLSLCRALFLLLLSVPSWLVLGCTEGGSGMCVFAVRVPVALTPRRHAPFMSAALLPGHTRGNSKRGQRIARRECKCKPFLSAGYGGRVPAARGFKSRSASVVHPPPPPHPQNAVSSTSIHTRLLS